MQIIPNPLGKSKGLEDAISENSVVLRGRGALFASSVSLTSPLRSEVPEKTKVATSISRSIPFHPVPSKPYVTGRNADASKSGRILRFFRRSPGREKPPRPCHTTLAGRGVALNRKPRVRHVVLIIIANIRNKAEFRSRDPLRRKSEWPFGEQPSPNRKPILRC